MTQLSAMAAPYQDLRSVRLRPEDGCYWSGNMPASGLVALALTICAWLAILAPRAERRSEASGYGFIPGGARRNAVDRVRLGGVTDVLDLYVGAAHRPGFNLGDTAIFCGFVPLFIGLQVNRKTVTGAV